MNRLEVLPEEALEKVQGKILCCQCGIPIDSNPANMCVACLRTQVDITEGIPKQVTIHFCRNCERYLNPPNQWVNCSLESRELMALCLKKLKPKSFNFNIKWFLNKQKFVLNLLAVLEIK